MKADGEGILANLDATDEEISLAWGKAIAMAFRSHERAAVPVAWWDDATRRVILSAPDELPVPEKGRQTVSSDTTN
jgi:hypothetical protein